MDKMKARMMAMSGKAKEMPFGKDAMAKLHAKKHGGDAMLAEMMGEHGSEEQGEPEQSMGEELGELSPEEKMLIMAYRKKKGGMA